MISITGKLYDSRTSAQIDAICRIYDNGTIRVERLEDSESLVLLPRYDIKASPRLADTSRRLYFPAGEKFETKDNDAQVQRVRREMVELPVNSSHDRRAPSEFRTVKVGTAHFYSCHASVDI